METSFPNRRDQPRFKNLGLSEDDDPATDSRQHGFHANTDTMTEASHHDHTQGNSLLHGGFNPYAYGHPSTQPPKMSAKPVVAEASQTEPKNVSHEPDAAKASYETLKLDGETREQTLKRLQQRGIQEVYISALKHDKDGLQTTNLAELKTLRVELDTGGQHPNQPQRKNRTEGSDLRAPAWSLYSNAASSAGDLDSTKAMGIDDKAEFGRMISRVEPDVRDAPLKGWDGNFQPPPEDWEQRVKYQLHADNIEHRQWLRNWLDSTIPTSFALRRAQVPNIDFVIYPKSDVLDVAKHADGIGLVARETTIDASNGAHYGYQFRSDTFLKGRDTVADFDGDCSMDLSLPQNFNIKDETTNMYIQAKTRTLFPEKLNQTEASSIRNDSQQPAFKPMQEPRRPKANFYLRPAVRSDVRGMMAIYNYHIKNGVRPSELNEIGESEMHQRMDMAQQSRLPFIVAVERSRGNARKKTVARTAQHTHPIHNVDTTYSGVIKDEHVIGWASATDWSCFDYVENITADLECFVAHNFRRNGVGRSLMDALLSATDPGYTKSGGYDFHAAQEVTSFYTGGGVRDISKLIIQVRSYSKPMTPEAQWLRSQPVNPDHPFLHAGRPPTQPTPRAPKPDFSPGVKIDDREDDYQAWLKKWLESYGFEEEACLRAIGTKHSRYLDVRYVTRGTAWQRCDGKAPDYQAHPIQLG
ncbi:hypothetical protein B0A52_10335 [Exophiala mesophila]|uniref:N-acetyltransferase domain-containing protein n=1 Tax=Exophiala mesophila TaxID=212818 RepID=A0A438MQB9_EXOME|nr:hypothetical protein B0A52_10335 [Exophiala mesophila]